MSDELTAELMRVYEETYNAIPLDSHEPRHACALLAVARHSAERQRGMEVLQQLNNNAAFISGTPESTAPLWGDKEKL